MKQTPLLAAGLLRFRMLGPFQAVRNYDEINLGPLRQQAVLLPLVVRPGYARTPEEILDGVWGEAVPTSGIALVRTYVSRLRLVLGRDMIVRSRAGYSARIDPDQVDVAAFEQHINEAAELRRQDRLDSCVAAWRKALRLWRGPPLPGLPGPLAASHRLRLTDLHLSALEQCWGAELLLGRHAELLVELSAAVRDQPLKENLTRLLMIANYQSGRQAEAVVAFEHTRRLLAEELGLQPAPDLQQLYDRIRSGDCELL